MHVCKDCGNESNSLYLLLGQMLLVDAALYFRPTRPKFTERFSATPNNK
jgi:hypothetical protein